MTEPYFLHICIHTTLLLEQRTFLSHNLTLNEMLNCCVFCTSNWILCRSHAAHGLNGFYLEHNLVIELFQTSTKNTICHNSIECWTLNHLLRYCVFDFGNFWTVRHILWIYNAQLCVLSTFLRAKIINLRLSRYLLILFNILIWMFISVLFWFFSIFVAGNLPDTWLYVNDENSHSVGSLCLTWKDQSNTGLNWNRCFYVINAVRCHV